MIDRLKRAHQIGVKLVFGTDTVVDLPGKNRAGMMLDCTVRRAGMPRASLPRDTLRAMITEAANLLKIEKMRGLIAPGFAADIISTPANPLQDSVPAPGQLRG